MKHLKTLCIGILPIMWFAYCIFEFITGRMTNVTTIFGNIIFILICALVGYLFYLLSEKYTTGFSHYNFLRTFIVLMLLDQGIKIIIKSFFFESQFTIINEFLYFTPIINKDGSWINARFDTGFSFAFLIAINIIALVLFAEIYRYFVYCNNNKSSFFEDACFLFIFSGALCSLIDKLFYGGSLDFMNLGQLFVADIKDIYINLGLFLFIISIYKNGFLSSNISTTVSEDIDNIKKFLSFVKNDFIH